MLVQQGWPGLCGTGLSCQHFWHDLPWQVSVHSPSGCVCVGPVTHRAQQEPREHGEEKQKCSGLFCAWRSSKSCSLCAHVPVKGAECRRAPLDTEQLCLQRGWLNTLMSSQTQVGACCHTAAACSALTTILLPAQLSTPVSLHQSSPCLVPGTADTPWPYDSDASVLCSHLMRKAAVCPAGEWVPGGISSEPQPQLQLSAFFPWLYEPACSAVAQFSSAKPHRNTVTPPATSCSDSWYERAPKSVCSSMGYLKMFLKYWLSLILCVDFSFSKKSWELNRSLGTRKGTWERHKIRLFTV